MAALLLPMLCTAHSTSSSPAAPRRQQTNNRGISATPVPSRRPVTVRAAEAATTTTTDDVTGNSNKLSAWTSVRQERWEGELAVEGNLPSWLNGTYLRNGPGLWDVGGAHAFHHLFDGYATLVRVAFRGGHATGAHRQIHSDVYASAMANGGRPVLREFSAHLRATGNLLDRVGDVVGALTGAALTDNPNSAVVPLGDGRVLCLTETTKSSFLIDPDTLATVGKFAYADGLAGLGGTGLGVGMMQSAHPMVVPTATGTGELEFLTVLPELAPRPGYVVVSMAAGSSERKVVGRVDCRGGPTPGWMHAFAVTDNYVVLPEMPFRYSAGGLVRSEPAPYYAFDWVSANGSYMHVMCRRTGATVASVEVPPFMAIHYINAYEDVGDDGGEVVVVDCCEHGDPAIIHALHLNKLRSSSSDKGHHELPDARVGRFRIPLDGSAFGELETAVDPEEHGHAMDMCSINPAFLGKKYRYAYACGARRPCNFPNTITKVDLLEKTARVRWHEDGAVPSEPFFVARPGATQEDDGVVISIVSGAAGDGYALVLDATTFQEIARVRFPYGLPYGFHGCWIPDHQNLN